MATITKIFKPRRGLKSTMYGSKASTVLSSGEMFVECQGSTVGKGKVKLKIGDGSTAYSSLDYALGDTSTDPISFSNNSSSTASAALNSVASGNSLQTIVGGLKQAASLNASSISKLNDDLSSNKSSISSINSSISSLNSKVSTNTSNISSLTTKANNNTSSISNLSNRVTTLESNGNHYWEYIGSSNGTILQKDYSFVLLMYNKRYGSNFSFTVERASDVSKGSSIYANWDSDGKNLNILGYV